jgi:acetyltransferase
VAVVGVSSAEDNLGKNVTKNLLEMGFQGEIYLVGAQGGSLFGKEIYTSVAAVPGHVDLVNILTPARSLPGLLREWGERGTKAAVLITAGFTEYGEERRGLEQEVLDTARRYGIRLIGPNCQGIINTENGLCLPFVPFNRQSIRQGRVAIISQSGSVAIMLAYMLSDEPLGVSKFLSVGNKLDMKEVDLLPLLYEDEQTEIICLYMEGIDEGRELVEVARKSPKPILVYKGNRHGASNRIARSHTAALADDRAVTEAALLQANMIRVDRLPKFVSYAKALTMPPMRGNNLAVMSTFGGQAVISADLSAEYGFNLPPIPEPVLEEISRYQRAKIIKIGNPMDLGDIFETEGYQVAIERILRLPEVNGLVLVLPYVPGGAYGTITTIPLLRHIRELAAQLGKPVTFSFVTKPSLAKELQEQENLNIFPSPEDAVEALAVSRDYWQRRMEAPDEAPSLDVNPEAARSILTAATGRGRLSTPEAARLLQLYGIPMADMALCQDAEQAVEEAERLGYPVVLKAESPQLSHKSDVGGVVVGLQDGAAVKEAFRAITEAVSARVPGAHLEGVLVQRMVLGREVILGARQDEHYGPVVMFGLGGIHVEVLQDVVFRLAPLGLREAKEMLSQIRGFPLLMGRRGEAPADLSFLVDCLLRLSRLASDQPAIKEIDLNPLMVLSQDQGGMVVDVRMVLGDS